MQHALHFMLRVELKLWEFSVKDTLNLLQCNVVQILCLYQGKLMRGRVELCPNSRDAGRSKEQAKQTWLFKYFEKMMLQLCWEACWLLMCISVPGVHTTHIPLTHVVFGMRWHAGLFGHQDTSVCRCLGNARGFSLGLIGVQAAYPGEFFLHL